MRCGAQQPTQTCSPASPAALVPSKKAFCDESSTGFACTTGALRYPIQSHAPRLRINPEQSHAMSLRKSPFEIRASLAFQSEKVNFLTLKKFQGFPLTLQTGP
jgi:hypothetical protein